MSATKKAGFAGFAGIPPAIAEMALKTPGGSEVLGVPPTTASETAPAAPKPPPAASVSPVEPGAAPEANERFAMPAFPRKPATRPVNLRMDEALYWEISDFSKLSGVSITEIVQMGAREALAKLKKKHGLE